MNICLTWHNLNSENYGVGALGVAHIGLLLKAAANSGTDITLTTFGTINTSRLSVREELESMFEIKIRHIDFSPKKDMKSLIRFKKTSISQLTAFDLILDLGEGDSFTDIYGYKRFMVLAITKLVPLLANIKIVLSPQTIGPFNSFLPRALAKWLMKKSEAVFARDHKSVLVANELGVMAYETTDVAFSLPYSQKEKLSNSVGLNVSALLWNGGYNEDNQFNLKLDYKELTHRLIQGLLKRKKVVHLVAHVISKNTALENDYLICTEIKRCYEDNMNIVLAPEFVSPIEAKSYISQLEFFTGARMHATIASVSAGVPTIPIAYSMKFDGVFGNLGYDYTLEAFSLEIDSFEKTFFDYFDHHQERIVQKLENARSKAKLKNLEYVSKLEGILNNA